MATSQEAKYEPTCVSLFSGIGGLDHGLARARFRHLAFCESDPYRRDVLTARWPGVPVYEDVRDMGVEAARDGHGEQVGYAERVGVSAGGEEREALGWPGVVDLLCGGFPCQDLSVAGQRRGLAGDRSGLFFEFARIADALRPRWLLVENVPGLLSSNNGRDFGVVLATLAELGYGLAYRVLDSRFFGVPQRRRRVYIVGAVVDDDPRAAAERAGEVLAVGTRCPGHPATRTEAGPDTAGALGGISPGGGWRIGADEAAVNHVVASLTDRQGRNGDGTEETFIAGPLGDGNDGIGRRSEDDPNLVTHSLTSEGHDASEAGTGRGTPLTTTRAFDWQQTGSSDRAWLTGSGDYAQHSANRVDAIYGGEQSVRRLTPRECERLQALPDDWTQLGDTPDSRRYAALGDAVTATVSEWIGRRLIRYGD